MICGRSNYLLAKLSDIFKMEQHPMIVTEKQKDDENYEVDLDQALNLAGVGCYNLKYSLVLSMFLIATIAELGGYGYVLPAAKCDLAMTDAQRGFIASLPYIGIVITSFPWGYLVDTQGRKKIAVWSSLVGGFFAVLSAFMPGYTSFVICKFFVALCIAAPSSIPFTFIGELIPQRHRDLTMTMITTLQVSGSAIVPILAWIILPTDFRVNFGSYDFRPWRLLCIVNALFFLLSSFLMSFGPESPKYLVAQGRYDEALEVLANIYAGNKRTSPEDYPVKALKVTEVPQVKRKFLSSLKEQSIPLLRAPYHKWLLLNGILLVGVFATLNGLNIWVPDILNRVLTGDTEGLTACQVIELRLNATADAVAVAAKHSVEVECNDTITKSTCIVKAVASLICSIIAVIGSSTVKIIGNKALLVLLYTMIGSFTILVNAVSYDIVYVCFLTSLPIICVAVGPINAYAVEIFPTALRGMAVSLAMMCGRLGSVAGANVAGVLLNVNCPSTFYLFGGSLILCACLSFLLPKSGTLTKPEKALNPQKHSQSNDQFTNNLNIDHIDIGN